MLSQYVIQQSMQSTYNVTTVSGKAISKYFECLSVSLGISI